MTKYQVVGYAIATDKSMARLVIRGPDETYFTVDVTENDGIKIDKGAVSVSDRTKFNDALARKIKNAVVGIWVEL
jgi:hypothetical protein